ncbi:MAG: TonB-dependent receptor plug domain-containing protein, partial [Pseudomonadota bacterium]
MVILRARRRIGPPIGAFAAALFAATLANFAAAQTAIPQSISIPEGSLRTALEIVSEAFDANIMAPDRLLDDKTVAGIDGQMTLTAALEELLAGSGLTAEASRTGAIVIREVPQQAPAERPQTRAPRPAATPRVEKVDEIVVRGELLARPLQDTQSSVAVLTGDELDQLQDRNLYTTLNRIANVSQAAAENGISIRGIESRGLSGSTGLTVNVTVDGASLVSQRSLRLTPFSNWDMEQIEVLRGPQSTQSGRNALAGAVNIRTKDPTFDYELKGRVDAATFNERRIALAGNLPIVDDLLAIRLSYENLETDGFIENTILDDDNFGFQDAETLRAKLRLTPSDSVNIVLTHSTSDNTRGAREVDPATWPADRVNLSTGPDITDADFVISNLNASWAINDRWSVLAEISDQETDHDQVTESPGLTGTVSVDDESSSQQVRLVYSGETVSGVVGIYRADIESNSNFGGSFGGGT